MEVLDMNVLLRLKRLLNTIPDEELKVMDLWVDGQYEIDKYLLETYTLNLLSKDAKIKINDYEL